MLRQSQRVWAQPSGIWAWTCLTVRLERMFLQIRPSYNHLSRYQGNITLAIRAKILPICFSIASLSRNLSLHLCIYIYIFFSESFEGKLVMIPIMFIVCPWSLSHVRLFATPWTVACQVPLSMGFSRQESWRGLPSSRGFSRPRDWAHVSYISCIGRWVLLDHSRHLGSHPSHRYSFNQKKSAENIEHQRDCAK